MRIPLRMSEDMLSIGDDAVHGEDAYKFEDPMPAIINSRPGSRVRGSRGRPVKKDSEVTGSVKEASDM